MTTTPRKPAGRRRGIVGTSAVCLALGASKWGSHLGIGSLFLTDILLACAVVRIVRVHGVGAGRGTRSRPASRVPGALALFLTWCCVRLAAGDHYSMTALRDFVPYSYAAVAVIVGSEMARPDGGDRDRSVTLIHRALIFHLCWVTVAVLAPFLVAGAPRLSAFGGVDIFQIRTDFDMAALGLTASLYLWRATRGGRRYIVGVMWCVLVAAGMNSRAGFISLVLSLTITYLILVLRRPATSRRHLALFAVGPALVIAALVALPETVGGAKLMASIGISQPTSAIEETGVNTARARQQAWTDTRSWVAEQHAQAFGVGFGPNFLAESGALVPLGSNPDLRSPHNYFIGTYARLGAVGVVLFVLILLRLLRDMFTVSRHRMDDLALLAVLAPFAFVSVAAFGVILESPFAAVPFFWFAGVLMADARRLSRTSAAVSQLEIRESGIDVERAGMAGARA
jgi:O-antigen ligase